VAVERRMSDRVPASEMWEAAKHARRLMDFAEKKSAAATKAAKEAREADEREIQAAKEAREADEELEAVQAHQRALRRRAEAASASAPAGNDRKKRELRSCWWHKQGHCKKEGHCDYSHQDGGKRPLGDDDQEGDHQGGEDQENVGDDWGNDDGEDDDGDDAGGVKAEPEETSYHKPYPTPRAGKWWKPDNRTVGWEEVDAEEADPGDAEQETRPKPSPKPRWNPSTQPRYSPQDPETERQSPQGRSSAPLGPDECWYFKNQGDCLKGSYCGYSHDPSAKRMRKQSPERGRERSPERGRHVLYTGRVKKQSAVWPNKYFIDCPQVKVVYGRDASLDADEIVKIGETVTFRCVMEPIGNRGNTTLKAKRTYSPRR
jgi:hypothetical protein